MNAVLENNQDDDNVIVKEFNQKAIVLFIKICEINSFLIIQTKGTEI